MDSVYMISYHPDSDRAPVGTHFAQGFQVADVDDVQCIAKAISRFAWSGNAFRGGYRNAENFLYSDWCVLDIDDELHTYSLAQALRDYCDSVHIIGTTRNHQKLKNDKVCDRYRVALPWERRITDAANYAGNMRALRKVNEAIDGSTLSPAQHFFPCAKIVSIEAEGFRQPVKEDRYVGDKLSDDDYARLIRSKRTRFEILERMPIWVAEYLEHGCSLVGHRHRRALGVAIELIECGMELTEVREKIARAPISRPWGHREVDDVVRYAVQLVAGRLRDGQREEAGEGGDLSDIGREDQQDEQGQEGL